MSSNIYEFPFQNTDNQIFIEEALILLNAQAKSHLKE